MADEKLNLSPDVRIRQWGVPSSDIVKFIEGLKAVPADNAEAIFEYVSTWLKSLGLDDAKRSWGFEIDAFTGNVIMIVPLEAYKKEPQNAREWSVLAGVCEQLGPLFELATGANASKREDN